MIDLTGHLLIAVPDLSDPNFFRSVVLVCQHDQFGAAGVVLNRPSNTPLCNVWLDYMGETSDNPQLIGWGGPVDAPLIAIHTSCKHSQNRVMDGVYFSADRDELKQIVGENLMPYRIFCGYAGWGPQQLESEIDQGAWLTFPANRQHIFGEPEELWRHVCDEFGLHVMQAQIGKQTPHDPSLN